LTSVMPIWPPLCSIQYPLTVWKWFGALGVL
jgi:hypothetical protein